MSKAFVKEPDIESIEVLPDRPLSGHPNDVTLEGMNQIEAALATARNAYDSAQAKNDRTAMAQSSRDLRYWSARQATARIVPNSADNTTIRFGSTVTILRDDGREQTFRIVGEDEANPASGSISHVSPLARSLVNHRVGDRVEAGNGSAEIRKIK